MKKAIKDKVVKEGLFDGSNRIGTARPIFRKGKVIAFSVTLNKRGGKILEEINIRFKTNWREISKKNAKKLKLYEIGKNELIL